jgi:hypothetical protein
MLTSDSSELPLGCKRRGCRGTLRAVDVRIARAIAEYELARDPKYQLSAKCSICGKTSDYTYSEIINFMPEPWRPRPLPETHGWTLLLAEMSAAEHLTERGCVGERLLVEFEFRDFQYWVGALRSPSGMAPSMPLDSRIGGNYLSGMGIVTTWLGDGDANSIPVKWPGPGTQDVGLFFIPKNAPDTLLPANLFCSNPSCGHVFSYYHSQLKAALDDESLVGWFWGQDRISSLLCPKCQTARVIDEDCINNLYKL